MQYHFFISDFNDYLVETIEFDLFSDFTTATEKLLYKEALDSDPVEGRTIIIDDTAAFLRALGVKSESEFENVMQARADDGKLTIDYLVRFCENNDLRYSIEGHKLRHAFGLYKKQLEEEKLKGWAEAKIQCREAIDCMRVYSRKHVLDMQKAYRLLSAAALDKDYPPAYGWMAYYYMAEHEWGLAASYASNGAALGDVHSMYLLALLYGMGADFVKFTDDIGERNYENAVKWCREAALKGFPSAIKLYHQYIEKGLIDPQSSDIVRILAIAARRNTERQNAINHKKTAK